MRAFLFFSKMAAKHLNFKMATNFSVQNDQQLFIYSYSTSKLSQNIHSMYFVKPNCLCMFFSIAFSLQQNANEHHRARFKSLENSLTVVTNTMHRAHQSHYFYCLKSSRIGSVHSRNIDWVSHQFHIAHGSALMVLLVDFTQIAYRECN